MSIFQDFRLLTRFPVFCFSLRRFLISGVSLQRAVRILKEGASDSQYRKKLGHMEQALLSGKTFFEVLATILPKQHVLHFTHLKKVPHLDLFLRDLGRFTDKKLENIVSLGQKTAYPLFLIVMTLIAGIIFLVFLLPIYNQFYGEMNVPLPGVIQKIIDLQTLVLHHKAVTIFFITGLSLCVIPFMHFINLRLFQWVIPFMVSDMLWSMGLLLKNGVSIPEAINAIQLPATHRSYDAYEEFKQKVTQTGLFAKSFNDTFQLGLEERELLFHAEKSAVLSEMLVEISAILREKEQQSIHKLIQVIQPIMLCVLGGFILCLMYTTFIPILSVIEQL
ncbi:MAG: type II secretion system F family protein [Candidatus Margulisbacteria bacterium]|nr:type II secretion system F family protein [Candidatus Margulisiibacteriota bacterium]